MRWPSHSHLASARWSWDLNLIPAVLTAFQAKPLKTVAAVPGLLSTSLKRAVNERWFTHSERLRHCGNTTFRTLLSRGDFTRLRHFVTRRCEETDLYCSHPSEIKIER